MPILNRLAIRSLQLLASYAPLHRSRPVVLFLIVIATVTFARAQNLTLEGQTGGFITPTAYTLDTPGRFLSHPAVAFHFVAAGNVIGDVYTVSVTEGFGHRFEAGYTRSLHTNGENPYYSPLWFYNGFNVFHGKAKLLDENLGGRSWMPGIAVGGVFRSQDHYVSGAINHNTTNNGDVYIVATKTALKLRPPLLLNFGFKGTNGSIYGVGGNAPGFQGRLFGGLGIILPLGSKYVIVPAAGFTQEPRRVQGLTGADIPTTLDYAIRITEREDAHFAFDAGVGQVAGRILPGVDLEARSVFGMGLSWKF